MTTEDWIQKLKGPNACFSGECIASSYYITLIYYPHNNEGYLTLHQDQNPYTLGIVTGIDADTATEINKTYKRHARFQQEVGRQFLYNSKGFSQGSKPLEALIAIFYDPKMIEKYFPDFSVESENNSETKTE